MNDFSFDLSKFIVDIQDFSFYKVIDGSEVTIYRNINNGKEYAVKKLPITNLKDKKLACFIKNTIILSEIDSKLILPFTGVAIKKQVSIVTKYMPNGSLYDILHNNIKKITLTPTNKTKISLQIAKVMILIHKKNLIHGDLKSSNILLDKSFNPKIGDFGFLTLNNNKETENPYFMAPELFESIEYTNKVDIYAYGILLLELLTEEIPFKGFTKDQIKMQICKHNLKPFIPEYISKEFRDLIASCLVCNSQKRPSFNEIYSQIIENKIYFNETDENEISDFISNDILYELSLNTKKPTENMQKGSNKGRKNIFLDASQKPSLCIEPSSASFEEVLLDPFNPHFVRIMQQKFSSVNNETCIDLFNKIIPLFTVHTSREILQFLLNELVTLFKRFPEYSEAFVKSNLPQKLPYFDTSFTYVTLSILHSVVQVRADVLTKSIARVIINYAENYTRQVLSIFSIFANSYGTVKDSLEVIDILISATQTFINAKFASGLCQILFFLQTNFPSFQEQRGAFCFNIYSTVLHTPDVIAVNRALSAITIVHRYYKGEEKCIIPFDLIIKLLENTIVATNVLNYLVILDKCDFVISQRLIEILVLHLNYETAYLVLAKLSCNDNKSKSYLLNNTQWMSNMHTKREYIFGLCLIIYGTEEMRIPLFKSNDFIIFINRLCSCNDSKMLCDISIIIENTLTYDLIDILRKGKVLERFYSVSSRHQNNDVIIAGISLLKKVCQFSYGEEVNIMLPYFKVWFNSDEIVQKKSLEAANALLKYENTKTAFIEFNAVNAARKIKPNPSYSNLLEQFLQNF